LTEDVDLFDGSFWSGTTALSLGLIDEIGIFYTEMVKKFGDNLAITTFGKEKGWLKRKLNIAIDEIVSGVLSHIYESSLWQRFTSY
jgi:serine protease SohB